MDTEPASHQHEQLLNTLKHASVGVLRNLRAHISLRHDSMVRP